MLAFAVSAPFSFKLPRVFQLSPHNTTIPERRRPTVFSYKTHQHILLPHHYKLKPRLLSDRSVLTRLSNDGSGAIDATPPWSSPPDVEESSPGIGDGYISLFVRMLGLDNDPLDREQAIVALWKYSLGGKKYVDTIMQFPGCINLTVNLLRSESSSTCEAAAGLLRSISMVNIYKDLVAESGAIQEFAGLLNQHSLTPEVKEQSICTLWNLSSDEKLRVKIANTDILPILIKCLDDEDIKVKEAAGGVLANFALSQANHNILVEAGVIPKLAKFLKPDVEGSKTIRKEARNVLLELSKDEYFRILIIEEGLVPVPIIGAAAYKSFKPGLHSWPSLPDGTEIERTSNTPSRFGASELLLGLNVDEKNVDIDEAKMNAIVGRTQQQFLARIGAIDIEDVKKVPKLSSGQPLTILPWMDGVARLVLILELENESAILRAVESIADASINEQMRMAFKEAGAIKHLIRLLGTDDYAVKLAVTHALEKLSVSNVICQVIEAEGVIDPLIDILKHPEISEKLMEKTLDILARILDPSKEMKSKFYDGPVNGSKKRLDAARTSDVSMGIDVSKTNTRKSLLESAVISRLVEILKTSSPNLQRKASSILEFIIIIDPSMDTVTSVDIASGLDAVFQQKVLKDMEPVLEDENPEEYILEIEEAGLAISAASRLLTKLLDSEQFYHKIDSTHFSTLLRNILKSSIPLQNKDWIAACLVKLGSLSGSKLTLEDPINMEVTLYETIPRLLEQIKTSFSLDAKEAAVVELNRIISEGVVDATRAVASEGGIFPLVKLIEEGSERAVEASLSILYNLSMDSENHLAIVAAGAVPVLKRIVLAQRPHWTLALHLLRTLPT
ncbi:hypothetical protein FEM48_Zijuj10G0122300 [Ziziphus jujuba var. spinosa]|uniref:Uncharacterized protein n=1 Tax=Ziziphus jujuba var. spinosa TaxID=714518 RepID=A0A978UNB5_ZIZJJ|nr:hypothetical protein FEM48_Zijuj10G0122300 [Ziziphus jujuba var. spinosa]